MDEGEGELRREQPGQGTQPGEDADSARGPAAILVACAGEERGRGELRGAREGGLGQYQGRTRAVWVGVRRVAGQVCRAGIRTPPVGRAQGGERLKNLSVAVL